MFTNLPVGFLAGDKCTMTAVCAAHRRRTVLLCGDSRTAAKPGEVGLGQVAAGFHIR